MYYVATESSPTLRPRKNSVGEIALPTIHSPSESSSEAPSRRQSVQLSSSPDNVNRRLSSPRLQRRQSVAASLFRQRGTESPGIASRRRSSLPGVAPISLPLPLNIPPADRTSSNSRESSEVIQRMVTSEALTVRGSPKDVVEMLQPDIIEKPQELIVCFKFLFAVY